MSDFSTFKPEHHSDGEFSFPIFRKGAGPGIILMHELPGLTAETVDFAEFLAANGFHVVMPLLFGSPLQDSTFGTIKFPGVCIRREFNCFASGKASPITNALRSLCRKIHSDCGGKGVGAIGMCFTGGFVLSMMLEPTLLAPVVAQPSLPFFAKCALDVESSTLVSVANRADDVTVLALRFELDWISPKQRMDRLQEVFSGTTSSGNPRFERIEVPGKGHSTLAFDYKQAVERGVDTRQRVLAHLQKHLN
jgi:dienelactone hydrolase